MQGLRPFRILFGTNAAIDEISSFDQTDPSLFQGRKLQKRFLQKSRYFLDLEFAGNSNYYHWMQPIFRDGPRGWEKGKPILRNQTWWKSLWLKFSFNVRNLRPCHRADWNRANTVQSKRGGSKKGKLLQTFAATKSIGWKQNFADKWTAKIAHFVAAKIEKKKFNVIFPLIFDISNAP